jgi:hypothetical protein
LLLEVPAFAVSGEIWRRRKQVTKKRAKQRIINGHTTTDGGWPGVAFSYPAHSKYPHGGLTPVAFFVAQSREHMSGSELTAATSHIL